MLTLLRGWGGCFDSCGPHSRRGGCRGQICAAVLMAALALVVVVGVETVKVFGWLF